jgi:pyruvate kinase
MSGNMDLQIVATVGPASRLLAASLTECGATALRLNSSHLSVEELAMMAASVRKMLPDCPLVIDLQGAKMRLGEFTERKVQKGEEVRFTLRGTDESLALPHREIFGAVAAGDTLICDDDRLRFRVASADSEVLDAVSLSDGLLRPRKGVNVVEHPIALVDITDRDQACICATAHLDPIAFAYSFMVDGREAGWIRRRAPGCAVIGKIERREGAQNAALMACAVDALWICRGDLGAQLGAAAMARFVASFVPRGTVCPVLMAGQVIEHLTHHSSPTRSEVCHLFDLVSRGYAGFVLSDETAIGVDPIGAVRTLRLLLNSFCK